MQGSGRVREGWCGEKPQTLATVVRNWRAAESPGQRGLHMARETACELMGRVNQFRLRWPRQGIEPEA